MAPTIEVLHPFDGDGPWLAEPGPFPHLARLIDLPPLTAQAAFDGVRAAHSPSPGSPRWAVPAGEARLELLGAGSVPAPPRPCYWSYREVPGRIRSPRWHLSISVRLLLLPWSATRTALAIELRRHPRFFGAESLYLHAGHDALAGLAANIEAWALAETRKLDAWLDSLVTGAGDGPAEARGT